MENKNRKVYPSKVGWGLLAFILLGFGAGIVHSIEQSDWVNTTIQVGILFLVVLTFNSISYEVIETTLVVRSFFWLKKKIPIESITGVVETFNPISAPAASLDRLEILYGKYKSVVISPRDKMGFIGHLKSISPDIMVKMRKKK